MVSLVNGTQTDCLSIYDRGLLYGQSLFETIAVAQHNPCLLELHLQRLEKGCAVLSINFQRALLVAEIAQACKQLHSGVLRVTLTMGPGGRGYLNPPEPECTRIITSHDYPNHPADYRQHGVVLGLSQLQLAYQPALAGIKHGNRLEQVLLRGQWKSGWQEALVRGQQGEVIEATQSNIFIRRGSMLCSPALDQAGVAGVMREYIMQHCHLVGADIEIGTLRIGDIEMAEEVFLCNSLIGVWPVRKFINTDYTDFSISQQLLKLMQQDGAIPTL